MGDLRGIGSPTVGDRATQALADQNEKERGSPRPWRPQMTSRDLGDRVRRAVTRACGEDRRAADAARVGVGDRAIGVLDAIAIVRRVRPRLEARALVDSRRLQAERGGAEAGVRSVAASRKDVIALGRWYRRLHVRRR